MGSTPRSAPRHWYDGMVEFVRSFSDLARLPRAYWIIIGVYVLDSMAYFGVLTLMVPYLTCDMGWSDEGASRTVAVFTGMVTLLMLGAGSYAEGFGLRRAIVGGLLICGAGRLLYTLAAGQAGLKEAILFSALLLVAIGEAVLQPVCYSGVKQYTDERTSSMGYGLIYAIMNAGIAIVGELSARFRPAVQAILDAHAASQPASAPALTSVPVLPTPAPPGAAEPTSPIWAALQALSDAVDSATHTVAGALAGYSSSGVQAVNWICVALTAFSLVAFLLLMTRRATAAKLRPDVVKSTERADQRTLGARFTAYFTDGPFANSRFVFFIFMLLPVRTLFAHQWLTMPAYILRAYDQDVANNMERLVNWINPLVIFLGVPITTALTKRVNVYTMMVVGSLVSAAPTFLLCAGPNLYILITYMVLFSVGEALWSARFLEYASELAPEGRIAQYMGLANIPWLLAKTTTGFYSGYFLKTFCPPTKDHSGQNTEMMWFIYGVIAMLSPIGLWMARRWVMAGLHTKQSPKTA